MGHLIKRQEQEGMFKTCPEPTPKEGALSPVLSLSKERLQALPASVATSAEVAWRTKRTGQYVSTTKCRKRRWLVCRSLGEG